MNRFRRSFFAWSLKKNSQNEWTNWLTWSLLELLIRARNPLRFCYFDVTARLSWGWLKLKQHSSHNRRSIWLFSWNYFETLIVLALLDYFGVTARPNVLWFMHNFQYVWFLFSDMIFCMFEVILSLFGHYQTISRVGVGSEIFFWVLYI